MTDSNRPKERRLHTRYTLDGVVELGSGAEGAAVLRDISMSGFACLSPVSFEEMAILEVSMTLPVPDGEPVSFKAGGAVVRSAPQGHGKHLIAVFFTHMDDENRAALERWIETRDAADPVS